MTEGGGGEAVVVTEDLTRRFDSGLALDGLSVSARAGEVLALLGPNGAGKTTTIRLLNGILTPHGGSSRVLGLDPAVDGDEVRRHTGVLTEGAGLDDRLTTRENLMVPARIRGMPAAWARRRADDLLERFGLADRADIPTKGFSTGQRKRVALARALLHEPAVLFLDEPTSGLDPSATREVVDLIAGLARDEGRTIVLCTHFLAEAGRLADRMAVLHEGRLREFGAPAEIAARLLPGLDVTIDLGAPASDRIATAAGALPGVQRAHSSPEGLAVVVDDRDVVPRLVADLVQRDLAVFGAVPQPATLEDVYFAVEKRARETEAAA